MLNVDKIIFVPLPLKKVPKQTKTFRLEVSNSDVTQNPTHYHVPLGPVQGKDLRGFSCFQLFVYLGDKNTNEIIMVTSLYEFSSEISPTHLTIA